MGGMIDIRIIVCGGRDFRGRALVERTLDTLHAKHRIALVIQGGAAGADALARAWAKRRGVACETHEAEWQTYGRAAGPLRNARMLADGAPDLVVAFPGGKGTRDMTERAEAASVPVLKPQDRRHG